MAPDLREAVQKVKAEASELTRRGLAGSPGTLLQTKSDFMVLITCYIPSHRRIQRTFFIGILRAKFHAVRSEMFRRLDLCNQLQTPRYSLCPFVYISIHASSMSIGRSSVHCPKRCTAKAQDTLLNTPNLPSNMKYTLLKLR